MNNDTDKCEPMACRQLTLKEVLQNQARQLHAKAQLFDEAAESLPHYVSPMIENLILKGLSV
jgi:hypothetical protein